MSLKEALVKQCGEQKEEIIGIGRCMEVFFIRIIRTLLKVSHVPMVFSGRQNSSLLQTSVCVFAVTAVPAWLGILGAIGLYPVSSFLPWVIAPCRAHLEQLFPKHFS